MSSTGKRRSQKERSAETSARLMNATIDLLHDQGLARTTTPEIARLAGVSRGALTHHFAGREAIIGASIADLLGKAARLLRDRRGVCSTQSSRSRIDGPKNASRRMSTR